MLEYPDRYGDKPNEPPREPNKNCRQGVYFMSYLFREIPVSPQTETVSTRADFADSATAGPKTTPYQQ